MVRASQKRRCVIAVSCQVSKRVSRLDDGRPAITARAPSQARRSRTGVRPFGSADRVAGDDGEERGTPITNATNARILGCARGGILRPKDHVPVGGCMCIRGSPFASASCIHARAPNWRAVSASLPMSAVSIGASLIADSVMDRGGPVLSFNHYGAPKSAATPKSSGDRSGSRHKRHISVPGTTWRRNIGSVLRNVL